MKTEFAKTWVSSKQPRKQRKYRANAPLHLKRKMTSSHLSKELREKHKKRSITPRKDDTVKVLRGKFKGKTGKIIYVDVRKMKVNVEGIELLKKDGTKKPLAIDPSNVIITQLNLTDKLRKKALERK